MSKEVKIVHNAVYPSRRQLREKARKNKSMRTIMYFVVGFFATVFASLGMYSSFAFPHKTINLTLDGKTQTISTWGHKVEDVLAENNIAIKEKDHVHPSVDKEIKAGDTIVVDVAKKVNINVDGEAKGVWTTASAPAEIVDQFSKYEPNVQVPARSVFADGKDNDLVSKEIDIKVIHDGVEEYVKALPSENTSDILQKINVFLSPIDKAMLTKNGDEIVLKLQRVERGYEAKIEPVEFETKLEKDDKMEPGKEEVLQEGKNGEKELSSYIEKIDGQVSYKGQPTEKVKTEAVHEVVKVGVKGVDLSKLPKDPSKLRKMLKTMGDDVPNVSTEYSGEDPRALAAPMVAQRGWGDSEYRCLIALWEKESHWNPNAYNRRSGATGIPQALPGNKMASAGADWKTNPATQIRWGLGYIAGRYGTPCKAWGHSKAVGWY